MSCAVSQLGFPIHTKYEKWKSNDYLHTDSIQYISGIREKLYFSHRLPEEAWDFCCH